VRKILYVITVLALGAASYSLPAFALADDYGQFVYTDQSPSRFAPDGIAIDDSRFQSKIEFGSDGVAALRGAPSAGTASVYESIDEAHKAW
jgi:hypothetical protein